jgi:multiple sugar transport system permease protein
MAVKAESTLATQRTIHPHTAWYYARHILRYVPLVLIALIAVGPFVLSFLGTFETNGQLTSYPPQIIPAAWTFDNWVRVWNFTLPSVNGLVLPRWFWNSTWLALVNVACQLVFSSMAAYALARISFRGAQLVLSVMIATMAIPSSVTMLPGYVFYARLGWINTYLPLIVPTLVDLASVLMFIQYFKSIPRELEDAALVDGANRWRIYWQIILPLSGPILLTVGILKFQGSWNNYLTPLLFLQLPELMTLPIGMGFFKNQYSSDYAAQLVGAMMNAIPVLILFFSFSRVFTDTGSYAGLAGQ